MAKDGVTTEQLDLAVNKEGLDGLFRFIDVKLKAIEKELVKMGQITGDVGKKYENQLDRKITDFKRAAQSLKTLSDIVDGKSRPGPSQLNNLVSERALGARSVAMGRYTQSLGTAKTALEALIIRENELIAKSAKLAKAGQFPTESIMVAKRNIEATVGSVKSLGREFDNLNRKAGKQSGDFSLEKARVQQAMGALQDASGNRRRTNFAPELAALTVALDDYSRGLSRAKASAAAFDKVETAARAGRANDKSIDTAFRKRATDADAGYRAETQIAKGFHKKEADEQRRVQREEEALGQQHVAAMNRQVRERFADEDRIRRAHRKEVIAAGKAQALIEAQQAFQSGRGPQALATSLGKKETILGRLSQVGLPADQREILQNGLGIEIARQRELNSLISKQNGLLNSKVTTQRNIISGDVMQIKNAGDIWRLEKYRREAAERLLTLQKSLVAASANEATNINRMIKLEEQRVNKATAGLRELISLEKQRERAAKKAEPKSPVAPTAPGDPQTGMTGRRGIGNILSPGYAGAAFARTSVYGAAAAGAYGIASAISGGAAAVINFEDALGRLQAITGSTDTQMKRLSQSILDISRGSRFATAEIAEAATVLGQAGLSTKEIETSLRSVSQLASASGSTIAQTTDVVTAALGSFQLNASETGRVADVLTTSLNNSKLNLEQVALGIQYAGQTASENNISFEQLVATLATMSQAGIRSGSTQGTGLRAFLTDLQTPTKKLSAEFDRLGISFDDINIKTRGLPAVLQTLAAEGFDASSAYGTLETRAAAAYLVLKNNTDEIHRQIIAQQQWGQTAESSSAAMNTLTAQWQRFKNNLNANITENTSGILGGIVRLLKQENDEIERGILLQRKMDEINPNQTYLEAAEAAKFYNQALLIMTGRLDEAYAVQQNVGTLRSYSEGMQLSSEMTDRFARSLEFSRTAVADTDAAIASSRTTLKSIDDAINSVRLRQGELKDGSLALGAETSALTMRFDGLGIQLGGTITTVNDLIGAMGRLRVETARTLQNQFLQNTANNLSVATTASKNLGQGVRSVERRFKDPDNAQFVRDLRVYQTGAAPGATPAQRSAAYQAQQRLITTQNNMRNGSATRRADPSNPYINIISTLLGQGSLALQSMDNADNSRVQYEAQRFLQTTPRGQSLSARAQGVMGKSAAETRAVMEELEAAGKNAKAPGERAGIQELYNAVVASITNDAARPPAASSSGSNRAARADQAAQNRAERNETFVSKDLTSLIDKELRGIMGASKYATTGELYASLAKNAQEKLKEWEAAFRNLAADELTQKDIATDSDLGKRYLAQTEREINEKKLEINSALLQVFLDNTATQLKALDKAFSLADSANSITLNGLQGRATGLDRFSLRNQVTDADRTMAQVAIRREQEQVDDRRRGLLGNKIDGYQIRRDRIAATVADAKAAIAQDPNDFSAQVEYEQLSQMLDTIDDQLRTVKEEKLALDAAFEAGMGLPKTFGESMKVAIDAYKEANGLTMTMEQSLTQGLGGTLSEIHGSFTTFFSDLTSGTMSVGAAFKNMAMSILKSLQQMASQAIANQLFGMLLNFAGAALGGIGAKAPSMGSQISGNWSQASFGFYKGGIVDKLPGYAGGGMVMNGSRGRDSVVARLRRREFVLQPSAVDSVGEDFLNNMNKNGARALRGLSPTAVMAQRQTPAETNVYVVAPEHKQQMGPNDVLLTIADDILRNGQTKKLIKSVAAGG